MFGDDKDPAPRTDPSDTPKPSEKTTTPKKDRNTSQGDFDFHDWAAI